MNKKIAIVFLVCTILILGVGFISSGGFGYDNENLPRMAEPGEVKGFSGDCVNTSFVKGVAISCND